MAEVPMATKTATINARIDPGTKKAAEAVFAALGLSTADAITLFFKRVSIEQGIPFDLKLPNRQTREALAELRGKKSSSKRYKHLAEAWEALER
jgi:DNA-damage-inducible protein J